MASRAAAAFARDEGSRASAAHARQRRPDPKVSPDARGCARGADARAAFIAARAARRSILETNLAPSSTRRSPPRTSRRPRRDARLHARARRCARRSLLKNPSIPHARPSRARGTNNKKYKLCSHTGAKRSISGAFDDRGTSWYWYDVQNRRSSTRACTGLSLSAASRRRLARLPLCASAPRDASSAWLSSQPREARRRRERHHPERQRERHRSLPHLHVPVRYPRPRQIDHQPLEEFRHRGG